MRRCISVLVMLGMIRLLCACALPAMPDLVGPSPTPGTAAPKVITFGAAERERLHYAPLIAQFNADNPDLRVQFVALDEGAHIAVGPEAALQTIASSADTALVATWLVARAPHPAAALYDLQPLIAADPAFDRADFYPGAFIPNAQATATYGMAREVGVRLLVYNQEFWEQAA